MPSDAASGFEVYAVGVGLSGSAAQWDTCGSNTLEAFDGFRLIAIKLQHSHEGLAKSGLAPIPNE